MSKEIFLHGVVLSNYRGIGTTPQFVGPFSQFNFFIGPNNAGKSSVLNFIAKHLSSLVATKQASHRAGQVEQLKALDVFLGATTHEVKLGIGVPKSLVLNKILDGKPDIQRNRQLKELLEVCIDKYSVNGILWLHRKTPDQSLTLYNGEININELADIVHRNLWQALWSQLTNQGNGDLKAHWIPETFKTILANAEIQLPQISLIPAIREISPRGESFDDWTGKGLIEELARLQNPGVLERNRLEKFQKINAFLQSVTERPEATIEIPFDREHVLVHMNNKVLPLESLGTGIHEVVMLAAFCTLMESQIVCIEEPEIHLHPILQRRLMQYLQEQTSNQYFIATHSPSLIDTPNAAIFRVLDENGSTCIQTALSSATRFDVCRDLGYKASDLLQANAIIWVEGPSDRIYLKHWLNAMDPSLKEGIDYSIMFYGGRLLSHLSANDELDSDAEIKALIALRQLNRNLVIVIDSDRAKAEDSINATKKRIQEEFNEKGLVWITAGREIENYIPNEQMTQTLKMVYSKFDKRVKTGRYDHVLPFRRNDGKIVKDVDKVAVAKAVCNAPPSLDELDLRERLIDLVEYVKSANMK
ncbi:MAG: AAA family ATPase [Methylophilaceae bacterium]|nr:AAA family ATPase [Methylophilaceae bacterium]